jgi:hypothetical protein
MAGSKINTYSQADTDILALQLTEDAGFFGKYQVSLTNYDNTAAPAIAAGSVIEVNGALFKFSSNETITGSPSDGTVYIMINPSTTTCTAEYTNTAPTWSDSKQGWYGTSTYANYRYLHFMITKSGTSYSNKRVFTYDDYAVFDTVSATTVSATTATATTGNITTVNATTINVTGGDMHVTSGRILGYKGSAGSMHDTKTGAQLYTYLTTHLPETAYYSVSGTICENGETNPLIISRINYSAGGSILFYGMRAGGTLDTITITSSTSTFYNIDIAF